MAYALEIDPIRDALAKIASWNHARILHDVTLVSTETRFAKARWNILNQHTRSLIGTLTSDNVDGNLNQCEVVANTFGLDDEKLTPRIGD